MPPLQKGQDCFSTFTDGMTTVIESALSSVIDPLFSCGTLTLMSTISMTQMHRDFLDFLDCFDLQIHIFFSHISQEILGK